MQCGGRLSTPRHDADCASFFCLCSLFFFLCFPAFSATYPFAVSGMPQLGPALLKSLYNVPDRLVATDSSVTKLGIGSLQVPGDGGFYDPNDVALFWKHNNLTGTPNTTWVRTEREISGRDKMITPAAALRPLLDPSPARLLLFALVCVCCPLLFVCCPWFPFRLISLSRPW